MELGLKDKVVVITGGTAGIGKAAALSFAREECKVAVCSRSLNKVKDMKELFNIKGYSLLANTVDVSNYEDVNKFALKVKDTYGKIDIWINNAAAYPSKSIVDMSIEEWNEAINVNLNSVFFGCKIATGYMKETGGGVILNASSFAAVIPSAGRGAYAAAKAAVQSMTKTLAAELASFNIRVNAYVPGVIKTDLTRSFIEKSGSELVKNIALNRLGEPEDVAESIVFLASDVAKYITGTNLEISGGKLCVQNPHYGWK